MNTTKTKYNTRVINVYGACFSAKINTVVTPAPQTITRPSTLTGFRVFRPFFADVIQQ